jgi:hypothetical protein
VSTPSSNGQASWVRMRLWPRPGPVTIAISEFRVLPLHNDCVGHLLLLLCGSDTLHCCKDDSITYMDKLRWEAVVKFEDWNWIHHETASPADIILLNEGQECVGSDQSIPSAFGKRSDLPVCCDSYNDFGSPCRAE